MVHFYHYNEDLIIKVRIMQLSDSGNDNQINKTLNCQIINGISCHILNGTVLTHYPRLGILVIVKSSIQFYDGEIAEIIYQSKNQLSVIYLRGSWLLIGEKMFKGQLTKTLIIDLKNQNKVIREYEYQKTIMESLAISCEFQYLASAGSSDSNRQQFFIIDVTKQRQSGIKIITQETYVKKNGSIVMLQFSTRDNTLLGMLIRHQFNLIKIIDEYVTKSVITLNRVRQFSMILFEVLDDTCFLSSKNGDISEINIKQQRQIRVGPRKRIILAGIKHIRHLNTDKIIITGTKGFLALINKKDMRILKQVTIKQQIMSLTQFYGDLGFLTTNSGNVFIVAGQNLKMTQFYTCHVDQISSICFMQGFDDIVVSSAANSIIVWRTTNLQPMLRIKVPNKLCLSICLSKDGKSIISGWSDDCIRFFNPVSGQEINKIVNLDYSSVTALETTQTVDQVIAGGETGNIRVWNTTPERFGIINHCLAGHKKKVNYLLIKQKQILYSCSDDGSYGIWNIRLGVKRALVEVSNFIKQVIPCDEFSVYCICSGSKLMRVRNNDGHILDCKDVQGSYLNSFAVIQNVFFFGGEEPFVIVEKRSVRSSLFNVTQKYYTYGEITKLALSSNNKKLVVGTKEGVLLAFSMNDQI